MEKEAAALALHRFGFGPSLGASLGASVGTSLETSLGTNLGANAGASPGHERAAYSIAAIAGDPRGALLSDLDRPNAGYVTAKLPSSAAAARAISDYRAEEQAKSKLAQRAKKEAEANGMAAGANDAATPTPSKPAETPLPQQIFQNEAAARYEAAVDADIGFVERLV